jgi:hypothetical protein
MRSHDSLNRIYPLFFISAVNGISLAKVFPSVSSQSKAAPLFGQILALASQLTLTCVQNMSHYNILQYATRQSADSDISTVSGPIG